MHSFCLRSRDPAPKHDIKASEQGDGNRDVRCSQWKDIWRQRNKKDIGSWQISPYTSHSSAHHI